MTQVTDKGTVPVTKPGGGDGSGNGPGDLHFYRDEERYPRETPLGPDQNAKGNLARLLIAVAAIVAIAVAARATDLLVVIVAIIVMVMLHELGHFVTAKL